MASASLIIDDLNLSSKFTFSNSSSCTYQKQAIPNFQTGKRLSPQNTSANQNERRQCAVLCKSSFQHLIFRQSLGQHCLSGCGYSCAANLWYILGRLIDNSLPAESNSNLLRSVSTMASTLMYIYDISFSSAVLVANALGASDHFWCF